MKEVFQSSYAEIYDRVYQDKDYILECDVIEQLFKAHGKGSMREVLDLGCGTGNHAIPLARRGYNVVGVDRSEAMLLHAERKAAEAGIKENLAFHRSDVRSLELGRQFDAALMMFAVLGYQLTNADVLAALRAARRHVRIDGLLIFDVWYGPAVLKQGPSLRTKTVSGSGSQITRSSSGTLDASRHICEVQFDVVKSEAGRTLEKTQETHLMRFFFPLELELFMETSEFSLIQLASFPHIDREPDETTWNVLGVARAC